MGKGRAAPSMRMPSLGRRSVLGWSRGLPVIKHGAITLREIGPADQRTIVSLYRHSKVRRYLSQAINNKVEYGQYMQWARASREAGRYAAYIIVWKGRGVGMIFIWLTARGVAELGFALHPSVWGTSVFERSARLMCRFAFRTVGLHRLELRIALTNIRAQRAARKLGARPEGLLSEALITPDSYWDAVLFSLL